ncbi:SusC/RagA family TonB-linked outer membrane protein [Mucilaginibacter gotjawali]|uniref:TonB dependent receptor n=2 Tax=Mucilaginibacter gotjawali TaxID=1550579 RepID=A0A0X8X4M9_9SPHI|nr:SusC/RagA family TonB-linked outer membrane protein [Mucilaginibacter gotjawali]MBB3058334.1 TonB-linked SusC/RagA family outer membrane protein [Mucilaginibacter gotjawali]BAU55546.1 TonB dependent receptor [Mucilaginibacter gotjawali]
MFNLKKLLLFLLLVVSCCNLFAQGRVLKGKVTEKDGSALPGVVIEIKGNTKSAVASGPDGFFSINISGAATLVAHSIGYTAQTINVTASQNNLTIVMQVDNQQLGEIVITGYAKQKKGNLTSAISVVSADKLKDVTSDDIGAMLQGKVAGLQVVNSSGAPGSASEIRLRGVSSVNASQSPLFVVDGIIGGNYDPNDVESVTVLKDAGATAIYGSQANGGVIIVTTKKAKGDKTQYEFSATTGFKTPDFGTMVMMNSSELYQNQKQLFRDYIPGAANNSYVIDLVQFQSQRPASILNTNTNWLTTLFKSAPIQNYHFSTSGKTAKNEYYFGATFYNEGGTFMNTDFKRVNLRTNDVYHFTDKITMTNSINVSGTLGKSYDYNDIYYAYLNLPWDNPYDANHNAIYVDGNSTFKWWSRDKTNPINTIQNSNHPYKNFDVNYDLGLDLPITPWLSFNTSNRLSAYYGYSSTYYSPAVEGFYHGTGYLNNQSSFSYGGISTNLLKFNFQFGKSALNGIAGVEFEGSENDYMGASGKGLPLGLAVLDVVSNTQTVNGYYNTPSIVSYLSQVNYSYLGRYFLSGSFRTDGSSAFPPSNRYASFPSISAGWLASNEDFLKDSHTIDNLKLRVSYGITGTQDIGAGRYLGLYSLNTQYNSSVGATPYQLESPNLTWESKHQLDAGFDIGLFHRINITVDAYHNITKNLLLQVAQPLSVGFETKWENKGQVLNNGLEFAINSVNIKSANFQWTTDFNISFNNNKLQGFPSTVVSTGASSVSQIYRNDGNLYEFYMPKWEGVNPQTGAPQWEVETKDSKGNVTSKSVTSNYALATLEEQGSALPKYQGGFNNEFKYKKFFLRVNTYFVYGNKIYNANLSEVQNDGSEPYLNQIVAPKGTIVWTHPGQIATDPSPQNNTNSTSPSTRYLKDGSYLSIRNIALGYSLPKSFVQRLKLSDVNVSVSADNVYTFTHYLGQDPATTITPGNFITPGVADFKYPDNRQFLLNINIKF